MTPTKGERGFPKTKFPRQAPAVTRVELIDEVARELAIPDPKAADIVETIIASIVRSLQRGERVEVRGFGSFGTRQRAARTAHNPKTGACVAVEPKKVAFFKPGKEVRELLDRLQQGNSMPTAVRTI